MNKQTSPKPSRPPTMTIASANRPLIVPEPSNLPVGVGVKLDGLGTYLGYDKFTVNIYIKIYTTMAINN